MAQTNPYEPTRAPLADAIASMDRRPRVVTVALSLFWILIALTALASAMQLRTLANFSDPRSIAYASYLVFLIVAPAFLLVNIAWARNWARIALLIFESLALLFRIMLIVNEGQFGMPLAVWVIGPALIRLIAFVLLFLPQANRWFAKLRTPGSDVESISAV